MGYQIELSNEAKSNIKKASEYYLEISNTLNDRFITNLVTAIDALENNPLHFQIRYKGIRVAHTKTFPFGIHFIIEGTVIKVLKILHHKQYYK